MRLLRRILLAFALAVSTTMIIPTTAVQAGPGYWTQLCFPPVVPGPVPGTVVINTDCPGFAIEFNDCPPNCTAWIGRWVQDIDPVWQREYHFAWDKALEALRDSHLSQDPKLAEQLRFEAIDGFTHAAKIRAELGDELKLHEVGWIDTKTGKFFEDESGMLWKIGEHLIAGQQLMIESLEKPELQDEAMAHYEEALGLLGVK
ncbi:hypothetical protein [Glycomyces sp. NPDC021274]|uniref:hypothetical protein n=1 Tax=Glycomyces sp. NPDC021274 TaxID=3155120 RepID=UPI003409FA77